MKKDPEAEKWFQGKPAEPTLRRLRDVILRADPRMGERTKYGTVTFHCGGDFASFVQHNKPTVSLMFNRGGIIPGKYPAHGGLGTPGPLHEVRRRQAGGRTRRRARQDRGRLV